MATAPTTKALPPETMAQLRFIIERLFDEGQHWINGIDGQDWRRARYIGSRARRSTGSGPSVSQVVDDIGPVLGYMSKEASSLTGLVHSYVILRGDDACLSEKGIALLRPVLKTNFDDEPTLNFHIWFHCLPSGGDITSSRAGGWSIRREVE